MILIAHIGAPFGIQGFVKINSYTDPFDQLLHYQPWFIKIDDAYQPVVVDKVKIQNDHIVVRFKDCHDRTQASRYTNTALYIPRDALPALATDEYYLSDLEGLNIYQIDGSFMGTVQWIMRTGANDVLVVWDVERNKEHLIPFLLNDTIITIDLKQRIAHVNWDPDF